MGLLTSYISKGYPVIVDFQAWPDTPHYAPPPGGWANDTDDGHYNVVIGFDDERLFFMDPSTLGHYTYIPKEEFLVRWHDTDGPNNVPIYNYMIVPYRSTRPAYLPSQAFYEP